MHTPQDGAEASFTLPAFGSPRKNILPGHIPLPSLHGHKQLHLRYLVYRKLGLSSSSLQTCMLGRSVPFRDSLGTQIRINDWPVV